MFSGSARAAAKGSYAVDVVCVSANGCISSSEFYIKFPAAAPPPGERGRGAEVAVSFTSNGSPSGQIRAVIRPDSDKTVYFAGFDDELTHFAPSDVLGAFNLRKGRNMATCGNSSLGFVEFSIFLWEATSRIVVVDVDGTLTKSNVRGYLETVFLATYGYIHVGVVLFLLFLDNLGLQILYLTARPRSHVQETRELLCNMTENGMYLPAGPLFTHRGGRMTTLYMELIAESTATFKHSVLTDISAVYRRVAAAALSVTDGMVPATSPDSESADLLESSGLLCSRYTYSCPFFLGIGNKDTDATAYYGSGIAITNIIIMQKTGEVVAGGFVPQPVDVLDHHYSRSAVLLSKYGEDDSEAAALLVESIAAASPLTMKLFSSYSDPRLHTFTKEIILASSKVLSFGGEPHEENEGLGSADV